MYKFKLIPKRLNFRGSCIMMQNLIHKFQLFWKRPKLLDAFFAIIQTNSSGDLINSESSRNLEYWIALEHAKTLISLLLNLFTKNKLICWQFHTVRIKASKKSLSYLLYVLMILSQIFQECYKTLSTKVKSLVPSKNSTHNAHKNRLL